MDKTFLTIMDLAHRWHMGRSFVYEKVLTGEIGSVKLGRNRRIPLAEVEKYEARLIEEQIGAR